VRNIIPNLVVLRNTLLFLGEHVCPITVCLNHSRPFQIVPFTSRFPSLCRKVRVTQLSADRFIHFVVILSLSKSHFTDRSDITLHDLLSKVTESDHCDQF
jgi:hypothetical protein